MATKMAVRRLADVASELKLNNPLQTVHKALTGVQMDILQKKPSITVRTTL